MSYFAPPIEARDGTARPSPEVWMPLDIPAVVIERLPIYYRLLSRLEADGRTVISSQELGDELSVTPAQIRKDLSYFGRFGKQGRGYSVSRLAEELKLILGLDSRWRLAVVGLGRLGRAISSYPGFDQQGFDIVARFDSDPAIIGTELDGQTIRDVANLEHDLRRDRIDIGIVAVPAEAAQEVVDALVAAGIGAILNYAPTRPQVPEHVELKQINPVLVLQSMTYHLRIARAASEGSTER